MAVSIYTNIYSTIAQNNLTIANSSLTKSIERLSSGLRINHASDDASGLAISEKLRGQIRGLAKASMNAQDAISFLQTAEGGLEVIGDMLQRMRELAVQAGNGTYTANDRAELQKEVGQLKDEVNRIASSTEYNTKKLLTGDAAGLFSTNAPGNLDAIMRGAPAEGNYKLDISIEGGEPYEYKSHIFTKGGELVKYTVGSINNADVTVNKFKANSDYNVTISMKANPTVTTGVSDPDGSNKGSFKINSAGTHTVSRTGTYIVEAVKDGVAGKDSFKVSYYGADGKATRLDVTSFASKTLTLTDGTAIVLSGDTFGKGDKGIYTTQAAFTGTADNVTKLGNGPSFQDTKASYVTLDENGSVRVNVVEVDATTTAASVNSAVITVKGDRNGSYSLNTAGDTKATWAKSTSGSLNLTTSRVTTDVATATYKALDADITFAATGNSSGRTGTYVLESLKTGDFSTADGDNDIFKITFYGADGTPQEMKGSFTGNTKTLVLDDGSSLVLSATSFTKGQTGGMQVSQGQKKGLIYSKLGTDGPNFAGSKASAVVLFKGSSDVKVITAESDAVAAGTITFKNDIGVVDENTMLKDIKEFTNKDGRMILANTQTLTIVANGKTIDVSVEATDTVRALVDKLNDAFDEIGMGKDVANFNKLDEFPGVLTFKAGNNLLGDFSIIDFNGDESLLNALGITQLNKGENPLMTVKVRDAHSGDLIGKDTVGDNMLRNVIKGVDVRIKAAQDGDSYFLHIKDNRTEVQIGANQGQKFDISIARMDTVALEIDDANVLTMPASQRAITQFDQALSKVNSARATIGAQINRLEYTMKNLSIARQNLVTAESRIRDLDVAEESANFSRNQILTNAATAMLAQANQIPQSALQLIATR